MEAVPLPPPLTRVVENLDETNADLPGSVTIDEHGLLMKNYLAYDGLTRPMIDAYNAWVQNILPQQLASLPFQLASGEVIYIKSLTIEPPTVSARSQPVLDYPALALDAGRTYSASIYADMVSTEGKQAKIQLFKLPVMLGSDLDNLKGKSDMELLRLRHDPKDPNGYFIIKDSEKLVLLQEHLRVNKPLLYFNTKTGRPVCKMTCSTLQGTRIVMISIGKKLKTLKLNIQYMGKNKTMPIFSIFRLLGIEDSNQMFALLQPFLRPSTIKRVYLALQSSFAKMLAIGNDVDYIAKKKGILNLPAGTRETSVREGVLRDLFPQVPDEKPLVKLQMLCIMIARTTEYLIGLRKFDDRDSWSHKKLDSAAKALEQLVMGLWMRAHEDIQKQVTQGKIKTFEEVMRVLPQNKITDDIVSSFSSNNWGVKDRYNKENITDYLKRDTMVATYSHLLRINTPTSRKTKSPHLREVQASGLGYICPSSTPEGESCLEVSTEVSLPNGQRCAIGDLKNGDIVLTVDPITLEVKETAITNHFVRPSDEMGLQMFEVMSLNGRIIKATEDHPFLTQRGWIKAKDLVVGEDRLCITPQVKVLSHFSNNEPICILNRNQLQRILSEAGVKESLVEKHTNDLETKGYLPLYSNHKYLSILAHMCGFNLADGSISICDGNPSTNWCFGREFDAEFFEREMEKLGFNRCSISEQTTEQTSPIDGHKYSATTVRVSHGGCFASLLLGLGLSFGRRVEKPSYPVPEWIMNGSPAVKREFLAGFQGGDGAELRWNVDSKAKNSCRFTLLRTVKHKVQKYVDTLTYFMKQIEDLFHQLGIETRGVFTTPDYDDRWQVRLEFSETQDNLVNYMDTIGYRYSNQKQTESILISEYIKFRKQALAKRVALKKQVIELYIEGMGPMAISRQLDMSYNETRSITQQYNKEGLACLEKTGLTRNIMSMEEWCQLVLAHNGCLYIPLASLTPIAPALISDFTTVADTHSFIASDFVTHNCGIVKNLALTAYISIDRDPLPIQQAVAPYLSEQPTPNQTAKVLINGIFVGWAEGPTLLDFCLTQRRTARFYRDTAIYLDRDNYLHLYTDGSRLMRPLLIVDPDGELVISKKGLWKAPFDELLREGCVEYIDAMEQEGIMLAQSIWDMQGRAKEKAQLLRYVEEARSAVSHFASQMETTEEDVDEGWVGGYRIKPVTLVTETGTSITLTNLKEAQHTLEEASGALETLQKKRPFTHCELDPQAIISADAAIMPMPETSQGPRVTYQVSMIKQALGIYHSNYQSRFDTTSKVLAYPTRPIFEPQINRIIGMDTMPAGSTVIVAFMPWKGFNQEDAIIFKKEALDNGLFTIVKYMSHKSSERYSQDFVEKFGIPEVRKGEPPGRYAHLDENGIAKVGSQIRRGDCIIGKVHRNIKTGAITNASVFAGVGEEGIVDRVVVSYNTEKVLVAKVKIRQVRRPVEGDKFASRYAQKGTIGLILPARDMPFNERTGMIPDIIINPSCLPSRMTIGKLKEIVASKHGAIKGERIDASAFRPFDLETYKQSLRSYGYEPYGYETLRSGTTGQLLQADIFIGPCYYQALRHHVKDKIQMRGRGAIKPISHQPEGGRARGGGQRIGNMETDAFISHGASDVLIDRLCIASDAYKTPWCRNCGTIAISNVVSKQFICLNCGEKGDFGIITIPYSFKLLTQVLSGVGFSVKASMALVEGDTSGQAPGPAPIEG